jgi:hypothetical protein
LTYSGICSPFLSLLGSFIGYVSFSKFKSILNWKQIGPFVGRLTVLINVEHQLLVLVSHDFIEAMKYDCQMSCHAAEKLTVPFSCAGIIKKIVAAGKISPNLAF